MNAVAVKRLVGQPRFFAGHPSTAFLPDTPGLCQDANPDSIGGHTFKSLDIFDKTPYVADNIFVVYRIVEKTKMSFTPDGV